MLASLKYFERTIVAVMAALIALVILLATADMAIRLFKDIFLSAPRFLVGVDELLGIFGQFLIILLGFELLETVKAYLREDAIHVEVVLLVALIALARKVIVIEPAEVSATVMAGIGALMLSIAASYWLVMQFLRADRKPIL
jgi:uncharacterized membrane protein (DUF373 family)